MRFQVEEYERASPEALLGAMQTFLDSAGVRNWTGALKALSIAPRDFEEWFLRELEAQARFNFVTARQAMVSILSQQLRAQYPMAAAAFAELQRLIFDLSHGIAFRLSGLPLTVDTAARLQRVGFTLQESLAFPELAYRFGTMRDWLATHQHAPWDSVIAHAVTVPLTPIEETAIGWAMRHAARQLQPIFMRDGAAILDGVLETERAAIRQGVVTGMIERTHPLTLARQLYLDREPGTYRDYERVARTEIANSFAHGAFEHDVAIRKFEADTEVVRMPRPAACKTCLLLFTNPDGSLRRYRVADLLAESTPEIDVGVRTERWVRATVGVPHPNDLCSPWMRAPTLTNADLAGQYRVSRDTLNLEVAA